MVRVFPAGLATLSMLFSLSLRAADEGPWSGKVALGYLASSGNTDTSAFNFSSETNFDRNAWHHTLVLRALGSSTDGDTTAEAYRAAYKLKYDYSKRTYVFGLVDWDKDRFSGYDQQLYEALGFGRRILESERHELSAELGAGARQSDLRDGSSADEFVGFASAEYSLKISENSSFDQKFGSFFGSENTYLESISELRAKVVGGIALVLSYTVKHNTEVPAGSKKTDTYSAVSLEYAF